MPVKVARFVAVLSLAVAGLTPSRARAQPGVRDPAAAAQAERLFLEARQLMEASRFAEACPKLAESHRLDPAGGTLLNLAVCHEEEGRTGLAWTELHAALALARSENQPEREAFARRRIQALEPKLARLTVALAPGADAPGLEVRRDGVLLDRATLGTAVPVDPGPHTVHATGLGRRTWSAVVHAHPGGRLTVTVPPAEPERRPAPAPLGSRRLAGLVVGGSGLVVLFVGGAYGIRALGLAKDVDRHCPGDVCDPRGLSLNHDAKTAAVIADVGLAVGVVAVGVGTWLFLSGRAPREPSPGRAARERRLVLTAAPFPGGGAMLLRGAF